MADSRTLTLEFQIDSHDELTSSEFISLFTCIDTFGRAVTEFETFTFLDDLGLPDEYRSQLYQSIVVVGRQLQVPVEIRSVDRGSWSVTAALAAPAILWVAQKFVGLPLLQGWDESAARERMKAFFRDRVFGGARRVIENQAIQNSTFGNLKIANVEELRSAPDEPRIRIRLRRTEVIEVKSSDKQLIEDFLRRLRGR